ncbi:histidine phosphotransferase family protein [Paracoccus onubensis]|uniref:Histidine phosphotransferase n=1 Tax=Paracoccus onubensis TaxID=1675788 RepID=A0A418T4Q6_9RHOB|nr:histidine phosphotransferase family protein [Paracoccus onubensis]RJE88183.1 histidine phosphotransferase [Paracoccus onubensis]
MSAHTMRIDPRQLATLVGSRLCHDLVSPIGAIGNGIELLELSDDFPGLTQTPEMRLIADSVSAAQNRLQSFRIAFGHASSDQSITTAQLKKLLSGMMAHRRIKVDLIAYGTFPHDHIRMVLLATMCLEHALSKGGNVTVRHSETGWKLTADAEETRADTALWAWLDQTETPPQRNPSPSPSEVQFLLLAEAAADCGRALSWELTGRGAGIAF